MPCPAFVPCQQHFAMGAATCAARKQVHCETRAGDDPVGRTPAAGLITMDGHLAGKVIGILRRAVELAERNP